MLFSFKEFEHFFSEAMLRKGLQLYEAGNIALLPEKVKDKRVFQVASRQISLSKRGDKLLDYSCTCSKSYYCEHLAALVFYFQRDTFNTKSEKGRAEFEKGAAGLYALALEKTKEKELRNFFRKRTFEIDQRDVKKIFDNLAAADFELYCLKWKILFKPYFRDKPLTDSDIETLLKEIEKQKPGHAKIKPGLGDFELSLLIELSDLFDRRFSGDENRIRLYCKTLLLDLEKQFSRGMDATSKEVWMRACLKLLRTEHVLYEALLFLLPRVLNLSKGRSFFAELSALLESRKNRKKYSEPFDSLKIAKCMLQARQMQVFKVSFPQDSDNIEYSIAVSELFFCAGKIEKGFKLLERIYGTWTNHQKRNGSYFRDYLIQKAVELKQVEKETFFLKEALIFDLYILPDKLHRYLSLLNKGTVKYALDDIIISIKTDKSPLSQDKVNTLLFETKRLDDLIEELKKQNSSFLTLHKVVLLKWPYYDEHILNIYLKQLMEAFSDRRVFHRPEDLFAFSMEYFGKLPVDERERVKDTILSKLGGKSAIHKFVTALFDEGRNSGE